MKNIKSKIIIIWLIFVAIIATLIWLFPKTPKILPEAVRPINLQTNKEQELDILKQIFKDSIIVPKKEISQYEVESGDKIEYSVADESSISKKTVEIKLLDVGLNRNGQNEIISLTTLIFSGPACTSCRARLYIDVFEVEKNIYTMKSEQEFKSFDSDLFNSDITISEAQSVDINSDGIKEIQIIFKADGYFGLNKTKVAVLQQQGDKFKVVWQQIIHINMDNYGALSEENKQNYDTTFIFEELENSYPDIVVKKIIFKDKGIELTPPRKEELIYKWDIQKQEYYFWKTEKVGDGTPASPAP